MAAALAAVASARAIVERPAVPRVGAWQSIGPEGAAALGFAVDHLHPGTVYALTSGRVFRSIDGGAFWGSSQAVPGRFGTSIAVSPGDEPVLFVTDTYEALLRSADGGATWESFELGGDYADAVAVDPSAPDRVWAAVAGSIWRSSDRGVTWENMAIPGLSILVDRSDGGRVFAGNYQGIFRSVDAGASWQKVSDQTYARGFAQDPEREDVLLGWTFDNYSSGIVRSTDGGDSWSAANKPPGFIKGVAVDSDGNVYATTEFGLSMSRDGGSTWTPVLPEFAPGAAVLTDDSRPETVYASAGLSLIRTSDAGATFSAPTRGLVNPGWSTVGIDPGNPRHVLLAGSLLGVLVGNQLSTTYTTRDSGTTWTSSRPGYVSAFAVDPTNPERVYAAGGSGVFRSDDGGATWTVSSTDLFPPTSILMDPLDPATLYVGTCCGLRGSGGGVYKSSDSGATWHQTSFGFPDPPEDTLWWVNSLAADAQGIIYATSPGGLKRSTNQGGSWTELRSSRTSFVAVDPLSPQRLYVVIGYSNLERSDDGGTSWTRLEGVVDVTSVVPSPSVSGRLFAATSDRGVLHSEDYGETWESWNDGLRDLCIASLVIEAAGETLVAGTCSNGVYVRTVRPSRDTRVLTRDVR